MKWNYFDHKQFACKCGKCTTYHMDDEFITALDDLREAHGRPIIITSGYRCPEHNMRVSTTGAAGPHTTGHASDIRCDRQQAFELLELICYRNVKSLELTGRRIFTGIGVQQKGAARFIHLDNLLPGRPTIWSY